MNNKLSSDDKTTVNDDVGKSCGRSSDTLCQVRLHGRGGQGTVTAAELLSVAAFEDGLYAQAFPSFGSERMGAPVEAYCRVARGVIRSREPVSRPNVLVIQDATLLGQVALFSGLQIDGYVLLNSVDGFDEHGLCGDLAAFRKDHLLTVPATEIAREHLGRTTPNSALLGGFAAMTGVVSLDAVASAFRHRFAGALGEANVAAATAAYEYVLNQAKELDYATPA